MLLDILTELAQELGLDLRDSAKRTWLVSQVNHAARELYNTEDITGCEREQVFVLGTTDQQVALPWYVESVIAARDYDTTKTIEQVDMRPRYLKSAWNVLPSQTNPLLQWRLKGQSALSRNLIDEAALTVSLPDGAAATAAFSVYITGSNEQSALVTDQLNFAVGDTSKTTTAFFSDVKNIRKSALTAYDLTVEDVGGNQVSSIPSHQLTSRFVLLQVLERNETRSQSQLVEVAFKHIYEPLQNDTDVFTAGDAYDKCIYWKTLEHVWAKQDGKEDRAAMAGNKAQVLLGNIMKNMASNIEMKFAFGPNPTLEALSATKRSWGLGYGHRYPYY